MTDHLEVLSRLVAAYLTKFGHTPDVNSLKVLSDHAELVIRFSKLAAPKQTEAV